MGKSKSPAEKAADKAAKAAKQAEKDLGAAPKKNATEVKVVDSKTGDSRVYSEAEHGEDFLALAEEFASKVGTRKIVAA